MDQNNTTYKRDEAFEQEAWQQMHALLDQEMPVEKRKHRLLWWWLTGAACLLLLAAAFAYAYSDRTTDPAPMPAPTQIAPVADAQIKSNQESNQAKNASSKPTPSVGTNEILRNESENGKLNTELSQLSKSEQLLNNKPESPISSNNKPLVSNQNNAAQQASPQSEDGSPSTIGLEIAKTASSEKTQAIVLDSTAINRTALAAFAKTPQLTFSPLEATATIYAPAIAPLKKSFLHRLSAHGGLSAITPVQELAVGLGLAAEGQYAISRKWSATAGISLRQVKQPFQYDDESIAALYYSDLANSLVSTPPQQNAIDSDAYDPEERLQLLSLQWGVEYQPAHKWRVGAGLAWHHVLNYSINEQNGQESLSSAVGDYQTGEFVNATPETVNKLNTAFAADQQAEIPQEIGIRPSSFGTYLSTSYAINRRLLLQASWHQGFSDMSRTVFFGTTEREPLQFVQLGLHFRL